MVKEYRIFFFIQNILWILFILIWFINHNVLYAILSIMMFIVTMITLFFSRDPDRVIPDIVSAVVAPADGRIDAIETCQKVVFCQGETTKVSIFLSLFDVHINRIPFSGEIKFIRYQPGYYYPAFNKSSTNTNEQLLLGIETPYGRILLKQIAGFIARRIICRCNIGDRVIRGERFGMIKFGSRVEIYLPPTVRIRAKKGDHLKSGHDIIGEFIYEI